jgi:hypothetical protein
VLVRDYQGLRHTVTVVPNGFDWQGTTYSSLSAIARAITGTAWSGPRFFALATRVEGLLFEGSLTSVVACAEHLGAYWTLVHAMTLR